MRDYIMRNLSSGRICPVAELSQQDIYECLRDGVTETDEDMPTFDVILRLKIELVRRELGLSIRGTSE